MAPPTLRTKQSVPKDKFSVLFANSKTTTYIDGGLRHGTYLQTIAWNPLGTWIATGASDRTLRVWNPERINVRNSTELKGHVDDIVKVAFHPLKEAELCSLSRDGVVKFWDVRTKKMINEVKGLGDASTLAWHPDGENLIVGNMADQLYIISSTQSSPISCHQQSVKTNQVAFCHGGKKVFLTTEAGETKILSYPDFEPILHLSYDPPTPFVLRGHNTPCGSVETQPTGRFLATGGSDSIICLWNTTDWICQRTLCDMTGPVKSISFSFDGSYICGGSDVGTGVVIAHTETGETVFTVKTSNPSEAVAWHPLRLSLAYTDGKDLKIVGPDPADRR